MKETEWGRKIGTCCGSNNARYDRGAEPAVPAMTYGCMYHCIAQTKLNIEQTSVGFTHSHLITDTTISAQQQYHLSAMLVDRATEFFHITCSMPCTWLVASTTSLTSGVMTSVMWCLFSRKYSLNLSCKKVGDFKSSCEYRHLILSGYTNSWGGENCYKQVAFSTTAPKHIPEYRAAVMLRLLYCIP